MADLFLSYKAEDRARLAPLVRALEQDGFSVWWDAHIGGGDDWRETILRQLESARCVIVAWSKRSVGRSGSFVRDEATRALRRGTYLPVRIDKVDPPLGFGETQALDLHGWKGDRSDDRYRAVLAAVRKRLGIAVGHPARPRTRTGASRRTVLIGAGAIGAASIASVGAWLFTRSGAAHGNSIAVLPFENLSGDPAQQYFSDGIAEELRSALSRIAGLKVVARTSSEAVRKQDAKAAAHKLGVTNILTGSVRRSPEMIRVSAQLVDGRDGVDRWSDVYDRPLVDALQVQSDIANHVAEALSIRLGGGDEKRLEEGGTANPEAYDLVLKARALSAGPAGPANLRQAIGMINAAIKLDPKYAGAWVAKADLQTDLAGSWATSASESQAGYQEATRSIRRAIELAPTYRLARASLAGILDQRLDRRTARRQFETMAALPGDEGQVGYAMHLSETLHADEAISLINQAVSKDPLNAATYYNKASIFGNARRYKEALAASYEFSKLVVGHRAYNQSAYFLTLLGKYAEAEAAFANSDVKPGWVLPWEATLAVRQGKIARAEELLKQSYAEASDAGYYQQADILAQLGRKDEALATLEKAFAARDPGLTAILVDAMLDPLRSEPRFQGLVKNLDFPS